MSWFFFFIPSYCFCLKKAVKKIFQIMQEKKPKQQNTKNTSESKRLEKENKRLQLEIMHEREKLFKSTKEIQTLKEDLDKREEEIMKLRTQLNNSTNNLIIAANNGNNTIIPHHHHHHHQQHHLQQQQHNNNLLTPTGMLLNTSPISNSNHSNSSNTLLNSNATLMNSSAYSFDDLTIQQFHDEQDHLENWLSIPTKRNIKKHGWKKLYVVLKKNKLLFYNSLREKDTQEPYMIIDLEKVYHVRQVTQTDVVRVGKAEVAKIFQLLYDVEAVSGPGRVTYLGVSNALPSTATVSASSASNTLLAAAANQTISGSNETLSSSNAKVQMKNSHYNENTSIVNALLSSTLSNHNLNDNESGIGSLTTTTRGTLGSIDDYTGGDTMSLGSNDSGEVLNLIFTFYSY